MITKKENADSAKPVNKYKLRYKNAIPSFTYPIDHNGLAAGQVITIPGDDITGALKRYWRHGLFSDVKNIADKIVGNKIYLSIELKRRPRIADVIYHGVNKIERKYLEDKLSCQKGMQVTPHMIDRAKILIKKHCDEKGFKNAEINILEREDPANKDQVFVAYYRCN